MITFNSGRSCVPHSNKDTWNIYIISATSPRNTFIYRFHYKVLSSLCNRWMCLGKNWIILRASHKLLQAQAVKLKKKASILKVFVFMNQMLSFDHK